MKTWKKYFTYLFSPSLGLHQKLRSSFSLSVSHDFFSVDYVSFGSYWYFVAKETHKIPLSLFGRKCAKAPLTLDQHPANKKTNSSLF
jgi:hypothetical protein